MEQKTVAIDLQLGTMAADNVTVKVNGKLYRLVPAEETGRIDTTNKHAVQSDGIQMLKPFVNKLVNELLRHGRKRTAETYRTAMNSLSRFLNGCDIDMTLITPTFMQEYERYLQDHGLLRNSSSFYLRVLRTIYNRAVTDGIIIDRQPFHRVYTGNAQTEKRAVPLQIIQEIHHLEGLSQMQGFARDLFMFSFFTRGMAFVDIASLKPNNIRAGQLTYRRQKTGQQITMRWEPQMQEIINNHPSANPDYLFPIIKHSNGHERSQYRNCQRMVNCMLHEIGHQLNLHTHLTFYVARHSWASIARTMDVPLNVISQGMGHTSERTTQIYLKSLDYNRIDIMNANIIKAVEK